MFRISFEILGHLDAQPILLPPGESQFLGSSIMARLVGDNTALYCTAL